MSVCVSSFVHIMDAKLLFQFVLNIIHLLDVQPLFRIVYILDVKRVFRNLLNMFTYWMPSYVLKQFLDIE